MDKFICENCGKEFIPSKNDKRIKYCSTECRLAKKHDYNVEYYHKNIEKSREYRKSDKYKELRIKYNKKRKELYKNDLKYREEIREKVKKYQSTHPNIRLAQRLRKYGITPEEYTKLLEKQDYKCAICGSKIGNAEGDRLYVDHDHKSGKVRGVLCANCNLGLGKFKDDIRLLEKAIIYLKETDGTDSYMV